MTSPTPAPLPEVDQAGQPVLRGYAQLPADMPVPRMTAYQRPLIPLPPVSTTEMAAQIPTGERP